MGGRCKKIDTKSVALNLKLEQIYFTQNNKNFSGGNFSSYCGLTESDVCCKIPKNRTDVVRYQSLQSKCGKKGKDSGQIGVAEPTEWPWHVRNKKILITTQLIRNYY